MSRPPRAAYAAPAITAPAPARILPPATVIAGSLLAAWPMVALGPVMPPFGLLMLLAWRLLAPGSLRPWAAAPLGAVDDLVSGQPLGSAVLLWSIAVLAVDAAERRLVFRSFRQDWLIAAPLLALVLAGGRLVAVPLRAEVDAVLAVQIGATGLLFPAAARVCAWIDRRREGA